MAHNPAYEGKSLPIVFTDGSHPPRFPAGVLTTMPHSTGLTVATKEELLQRSMNAIKMGLMSLRHPDLDYLVDLYITRNSELAKDDTMANRERIAYERTLHVLSDPALDGGAEIWFYQTGFEPMIVGVYRGLTEVLRQRKSLGKMPLVVRPWLFNHILAHGAETESEDIGQDNATEEDQQRYTPESPGAQLRFYDPLPPWT